VKWESILQKIGLTKDECEIKTLLDIGAFGIFAILVALIFKLERVIAIDQIGFHSDFYELKEGLANFFDNRDAVQLIKADARYVKSLCENKVYFKNELKEIKELEPFHIVIMSKILHHLRTGKCKIHEKEKLCQQNPKQCLFKFQPKDIIKLFLLGKQIIIWDIIALNEIDVDKDQTGIGGHLTREELWDLITTLKEVNHEIEFFEPLVDIPNSKEEFLNIFFPNTTVGILIKPKSSIKFIKDIFY